MANLVRNFIKGRMNKSVDERLVPNGEYIDAQNIRMGSTEDSEIGAVENTKGNTQLTTLVYPPTGTALSANATCLGAYSDGANETMYWFVHDPSFTLVPAVGKLDLIVSYNMRSDLLTYHVVSIDNPSTTSTTTLNFDPQYLITGIDLVDDLLFFTDDFNPPRRIDVTKAYPLPSASNLDSGVLGDDILVIKRPPVESPVLVTSVLDGDRNNYMEDRLICFAYRYRYDNNEYSATSQFTGPAFVSKPFDFTPESFLNEGMENSINNCEVTVRTGSSLVKGIDILFKEMDDNIIRVIEKVDKADTALTDNSDYTITFNKSKIFTLLPESEILRLYDNVPLLAKAQTLMGNRLVYGNYVEGYDLVNEDGQPIKMGYQVFPTRTLVSADDDVSGIPQRSLHSNRSYEIGIIYMDEYNRSSTVTVNFGNDVQFPCANSIFSNGIRVQIPALMGAPFWASRYKFAIKTDKDLYETIYSNIVNQFEGHSYFLLEGENAAKVEEGDRYIVKRDASGPMTTCSFATVLEKKSYAEGELGTDSVAGTYMKILPDFNAIVDGDNLFLGRQSAGTNGGSDQNAITTGDGTFPVLIYSGNDATSSTGVEFETDATAGPTIPAGSRIRLEMNFVREGRGDASCETRTMEFELDFVVQSDHDYIFEWFDDPAEGVQDAIEAEIGFSGDPDETIPSNACYDATTGTGGGSYFMTASTDTNQLRFYTDSLTSPTDISFIAIGTNRCSGGLGSGSSPNRRSRINATWTIIKTNETFVFETEPTDALPDLWYESDESFLITPTTRFYRGNVQDQTATLPAIIDTSFFNCICYGNGVESYKIRDSVVGKPITLGNRVSTVTDQDYRETRRFADLTYSGVYNDETNVNKLNEFNLGLLNFKPLEDSYGPVEKLFGRRTDILTLQEDKISYVLAEKNLLTDSTGESVVASVPEVLGTQVARVEDFGISNNPESFAEWGPHKFFTDAKRGSVIHLYGDGQNEQLEVISEKGMRSWFRDEFIESFNTQKLGGYDPYMNEYVLASNDVFLPGQEDCIECNTIQTFLLTPAQQSFCVNLGNEVGPVAINYNIVEADDADTATITTTYGGGAPVVTGPISNASQPSVPDVNKDSITDDTVTIGINYTGSERFVLQIQVKCPEVSSLDLRLATVNRPADERLTIHSEFQWTDGTFVSPLSSTPVTFADGASAPIVSNWQEFTISQGSNLGPTDGSTVTMIYNRIAPDNYTLRASDRFRYLRSDTLYREADIVALLADGDLSEITPAGAQPEYTGNFLMPGTGQYLYLVWDYTDGSTPPPTEEFLLDTYTGAAAGYSVRRLATSATNLMRIREDAGDTETDIGYDSNNELDTAAIATHCGTANGFVVSWVDQSGNSRNATQSTEANQPQIYDGSAVITENGKPALQGGASKYLSQPTAVSVSNDLTLLAVADTSNLTTTQLILGVDTDTCATDTQIFTDSNGSRINGRNASCGFVHSTKSGNSTLFIGVLDYTNDELVARYNGSAQSAVTGLTENPTSIDWNIGANTSGSSNNLGTYKEVIIWLSAQSPTNATGIETDINSEYLIYQPTDAPTSGLLATYTGAAAAYSVRQLANTAVMSMRVRRDSDDEETNIGFDSNGDLDTAGIASFCGTANGYVTRWWDQSTNGNHADQATDTRQPQIYDGSAVITNENGNVAMELASHKYMQTLTQFNIATHSAFMVVQGTSQRRSVYTMGSFSTYEFNIWNNSLITTFVGGSADSSTATTDSVTHLLGAIYDGSTIDVYIDGSQDYTAARAATGTYRLSFGARNSGTIYASEFVMWDDDESSNRTGIETNQNDHFDIYT